VPEVSVVIPSFRGGELLREAVESVRSQTLTDWELILVMDGCDEDLTDIEQADSRVRIIRQPRRGVSIARNVGIGDAQSKLIALLDDDDRMLPDRLLLQSEAMSDDTIAVSHTQYRVIDQSGMVIRDGEATDCSYVDFLRGESTVLSPTIMFRKRNFNEVGGYNSLLPLAEGQDFVFRLARVGKICFIPDVLYEYRLHDSNAWFGTSSGSEEWALILKQHYFAARALKEDAYLPAVRHGLSIIPRPSAARAIFRASEARSRHAYATMVGAIAWAIVLSPQATLKIIWREVTKRSQRPRS
jgi:glycosyltransferase involved in cell wall biosynthesis